MKKILFIEDDPVLNSNIREALTAEGGNDRRYCADSEYPMPYMAGYGPY